MISSLSITLSSTYDFHALLPLLPTGTLRRLDVSLCDSQFSYMKTLHSPITFAKTLTDFSFNMTLKAVDDASSLYDILRFVSSALRSVTTLTILCRFADGIVIEEEKFRNYSSFLYSVNKYQLFVEMNNLSTPMDDQSTFNESEYAQPFWTARNVQVNIYRTKEKQIKCVRIYTLPLVPKVSNLPDYSDSNDWYKLLP